MYAKPPSFIPGIYRYVYITASLTPTGTPTHDRRPSSPALRLSSPPVRTPTTPVSAIRVSTPGGSNDQKNNSLKSQSLTDFFPRCAVSVCVLAVSRFPHHIPSLSLSYITGFLYQFLRRVALVHSHLLAPANGLASLSNLPPLTPGTPPRMSQLSPLCISLVNTCVRPQHHLSVPLTPWRK